MRTLIFSLFLLTGIAFGQNTPTFSVNACPAGMIPVQTTRDANDVTHVIECQNPTTGAVSVQPACQNCGGAPPMDTQLWLLNTALSACKTNVVNIVITGDSIAWGFGATQPAYGGWVGRLTRTLQSVCPSHGTGIIPLYSLQFNQTVVALSGLTPQNGWSNVTPGDGVIGPYQPAIGNAAVFSTLYQGGSGSGNAVLDFSGAAVSISSVIPQNADTAIVYYATYTDTGSGFGLKVDSGSTTTVGNTTSSNFTAATASVAFGTNGLHKLTIIPPASGHCYIYGVELTKGSVGVSVHNVARPGALAYAYGASPAAQNAFLSLIQGGIHAVVVSLGVNDNAQSVSAGVYQSYLSAAVNQLLTLNVSAGIPAPSLIVLDQNHVGGETASLKSSYQTIEQNLASVNNGLYLSAADRWQSAANTTALGMYCTSCSDNNQTHPNDRGHSDIAAMLLNRLGVRSIASDASPDTFSPTCTVNANAGTGASCSIAGTDTNGFAQFTSGSGSWASGAQFVVNFAFPLNATSPRYCVIQGVEPNAIGANQNLYMSSSTNTGFTVTANSALSSQKTYWWEYHCGLNN